MKKKVTLKRILHHDVWRYGIYFDYDPGINSVVKALPGVAYSGTNRCWHVPCEEEALKNILSSLKDIVNVDISGISSPSEIRKLTGRQPDVAEISSTKEDTESLAGKGYDQSETTKRVTGASRDKSNFGPVRFAIREWDGKLIIKFLGRYDPDWIDELKCYGKVIYDKISREWILIWSQMTVDSLADYFMDRGIEIKIVKADIPNSVKIKRTETGSEIRERSLSARAVEGINKVSHFLGENRYSENTIESYIASLELFFKYHIEISPEEITDNDISDFFHKFVLENKYSSSYQNQIVSAIKLYYSLNKENKVNILTLVRPRRGRSLPKVFSKEEVKRILNSTHNLKHKLILWIIYSCGLRRSEVINIRIRDLDRERGILNIIEAKGKVDRIVPVPARVWAKIDEYLESYRPVLYLFEGQSGGRYSPESVYRVFKQALRKAGIDKEVGVHSLRHSYATHLHESGLDIRYIQELLGHKSTKTTEIYTHVSRRNLIDIRSPIEDLDVK